MNTPIVGKLYGSYESSFRRTHDGAEAPRNSLECPPANARWITSGHEEIPFGFEAPPRRGKTPSVIARLMGIDMLPLESTKQETKRSKKSAKQKPQQNAAAKRNGLPYQSQELMDFLKSNKDSFLKFLHRPNLQAKGTLGNLFKAHPKEENHESRSLSSKERAPSRIVVLKPGPSKKQKMKPLTSPSCSPRVHTKKQASPVETKTTAKDFVKERLRDGSRNAKEIAKEIARQARESVSSKEVVHRPLESLDSSYAGSAPTLRRFVHCRQVLETNSLPSSPSNYGRLHKQVQDQSKMVTKERQEERSPRIQTKNIQQLDHRKLDIQQPSPMHGHEVAVEKPCILHQTCDVMEQPSPVSVLDFKEVGQEGIQDAGTARALDFESVYMETEELQSEDRMYVWRVLSSLGRDSTTGNLALKSWTRKYVLSPRIFTNLETEYKLSSGLSLSSRRLLFDVMNEILVQKFQQPWKCCKISNKDLLRDVWNEYCSLGVVDTCVENLSKKDLATGFFWKGYDEQVERIVVQVSKDMFNALVEDIARELLT